MNHTRTIQVLGNDVFSRLQQRRVIVFGVGGVGGWCAETLIRSGIRHLTIVDCDVIDSSNINRQLVATSQNIGQVKVEAMKQRLLHICPEADIVAIHRKYTGMEKDWHLEQYDYVIDAIDSIDCKVRLIHEVTHLSSGTVLFSSMGAGRKVDAMRVRVAEFWKVEGCPLARALRTRMKKEGLLPGKKFQCVYSPELVSDAGSLAPVVGVCGMYLTNLLILHEQEN